MSGLVSGYTGIIAPPNLATNGDFMIDQRGTFAFTSWPSGAKPIKHLDYICDAWYVEMVTTDYCAAMTASSGGIGFKGYGKKGQTIIMRNKTSGRRGDMWGASDRHDSTSTMQVHLESGVGVSAITWPDWGTTGTWAQSEATIITKPGLHRVKPTIRINDRGNVIGQAYFQVTLLEDGEFSLIVGNFVHVAGAFKNPPRYAPVPYADDLARCQRYYQTGIVQTLALGIDAVTAYQLGRSVDFKTTMSAIPTIAMSNLAVYEEGSGVEVGINYGPASNTVTSEGFFAYVSKTAVGSKPRLFICDWTAEVV